MATFTLQEVAGWDTDSVAGWLDLVGLKDCIDTFRENDVNGTALLDMREDDDLIGELSITYAQGKTLRAALENIRPADSAASEQEWPSDSESDEVDDSSSVQSSAVSSSDASSISASAASEGASSAVGNNPSSAVTATAPTQPLSKRAAKTNKKKDPLRIAAKSRSVAALESSTVTSGYLYKVGGSGMKMKHWNKRYFVLTDDNCVYYFKSPKATEAQGLIMLPSYSILPCDKADNNPGGRPFAWKAVNKQNEGDRVYIFASETESEMTSWMNFMSLASIAFGTGAASKAKPGKTSRLADDTELITMQERAAIRAGGVEGADAPIAPVASLPASAIVPGHLQKTAREAKKAGRMLALIKLLDGQTLQLYADASTTGHVFFEQVCTLLGAYETYYFGLAFADRKGDTQWLEMDQKVLKHDFPKNAEFLELQFQIRFYPIDVTQVMQYVTLYQAFLAARRDVVTERIGTTGKDSMLLAALSLQAIRGDYDPSVHSKASITPSDIVPAKTMREARIPDGIPPSRLEDFWRDELIRCWVKCTGILKHLAVLKYMQIIQKHRLYGMTFVDVKNKKGTPLVLGVNPRGISVYRAGKTDVPLVKFGWGECSELAFAERKFTVTTPDKSTKPFSVYCARTKIALGVLKLCVGLHKLFVQTAQGWKRPPPDLARQRQAAIKAALDERAKLQEESLAARARAEQRQAAAKAAADAAKAESAGRDESGDDRVRTEAAELIDMMMHDAEFMRDQDEVMRNLEDELGDGYDEVSGDEGDAEPVAGRERCESSAIGDRAAYLESLGQLPSA